MKRNQRSLADIQRKAAKPDPRATVRHVYGTVMSYSAGNLRVRPDGMLTGDIGPLYRLESYTTPAATHRVAMTFNPESKTYIVLGRIVNT